MRRQPKKDEVEWLTVDRRTGRITHQETALSTTRAAGLRRLAAYLPQAKRYGRERTVDQPGHANVSMLSVYLKHRLVLESEVAGAVLRQYPAGDVEKFLQELLWRTYWKGWLECHPSIWIDFQRAVERERAQLPESQRSAVDKATAGETDIACFNHWAHELVSTGYLHNHARLWFASIWIFTLRLPWVLGAAFFLKHLHDGDPAANTLSWRWVAGLHTRGKHYLARAANIEKYTEGRFNPAGQLNERAPPLTEEKEPVVRVLTKRNPPDLRMPAGLLLTPEDLAPEISELRDAPIVAIAGGWSDAVTRRLSLAPSVTANGRTATRDGLSRASAHFGAPLRQLVEDDWAHSVADWATSHGLKRVLSLEAPVGPWRDELETARGLLEREGIELQILRRSWDDCFWPYASAGYFRFKHEAWPFLRELSA